MGTLLRGGVRIFAAPCPRRGVCATVCHFVFVSVYDGQVLEVGELDESGGRYAEMQTFKTKNERTHTVFSGMTACKFTQDIVLVNEVK